MTPRRIQLRRTKGWRLPPGAISCARPSRWGNPVRVGDEMEISYSCTGHGLSAGRYEQRRLAWSMTERVKITPELAVKMYRDDLEASLKPAARENPADTEFRQELVDALEGLRGHDLACWCDEDAEWCHVDVLLEVANR